MQDKVGRQHQGMHRPGVCQVPKGSREQGKTLESGCEIICGAPMTLVKGLMMMMMMMMMMMECNKCPPLTHSSVQESPQQLHFCLQLGKSVVHSLVVQDGLTEGFPLPCVLNGFRYGLL